MLTDIRTVSRKRNMLHTDMFVTLESLDLLVVEELLPGFAGWTGALAGPTPRGSQANEQRKTQQQTYFTHVRAECTNKSELVLVADTPMGLHSELHQQRHAQKARKMCKLHGFMNANITCVHAGDAILRPFRACFSTVPNMRLVIAIFLAQSQPAQAHGSVLGPIPHVAVYHEMHFFLKHEMHSSTCFMEVLLKNFTSRAPASCCQSFAADLKFWAL